MCRGYSTRGSGILAPGGFKTIILMAKTATVYKCSYSAVQSEVPAFWLQVALKLLF
jgi:hypothetical protein